MKFYLKSATESFAGDESVERFIYQNLDFGSEDPEEEARLAAEAREREAAKADSHEGLDAAEEDVKTAYLDKLFNQVLEKLKTESWDKTDLTDGNRAAFELSGNKIVAIDEGYFTDGEHDMIELDTDKLLQLGFSGPEDVLTYFNEQILTVNQDLTRPEPEVKEEPKPIDPEKVEGVEMSKEEIEVAIDLILEKLKAKETVPYSEDLIQLYKSWEMLNEASDEAVVFEGAKVAIPEGEVINEVDLSTVEKFKAFVESLKPGGVVPPVEDPDKQPGKDPEKDEVSSEAADKLLQELLGEGGPESPDFSKVADFLNGKSVSTAGELISSFNMSARKEFLATLPDEIKNYIEGGSAYRGSGAQNARFAEFLANPDATWAKANNGENVSGRAELAALVNERPEVKEIVKGLVNLSETAIGNIEGALTYFGVNTPQDGKVDAQLVVNLVKFADEYKLGLTEMLPATAQSMRKAYEDKADEIVSIVQQRGLDNGRSLKYLDHWKSAIEDYTNTTLGMPDLQYETQDGQLLDVDNRLGGRFHIYKTRTDTYTDHYVDNYSSTARVTTGGEVKSVSRPRYTGSEYQRTTVSRGATRETGRVWEKSAGEISRDNLSGMLANGTAKIRPSRQLLDRLFAVDNINGQTGEVTLAPQPWFQNFQENYDEAAEQSRRDESVQTLKVDWASRRRRGVVGTVEEAWREFEQAGHGEKVSQIRSAAQSEIEQRGNFSYVELDSNRGDRAKVTKIEGSVSGKGGEWTVRVTTPNGAVTTHNFASFEQMISSDFGEKAAAKEMNRWLYVQDSYGGMRAVDTQGLVRCNYDKMGLLELDQPMPDIPEGYNFIRTGLPCGVPGPYCTTTVNRSYGQSGTPNLTIDTKVIPDPPVHEPGDDDNGSDDGGTCFIAGTQVSMADGTTKNIEDVQVGEMVVAYNEETGEQEDAKVLEVHSPVSSAYYSVNNGSLNVTDNHPLYVVKENGEFAWAAISAEKALSEHGVEAVTLEVGDSLVMVDGTTQAVENLERIEGEIQTYNLSSIENYHTFYADGVLAHNKGPGSGCFVAGTQVSMADGTTKNIEEVVTGEIVIAFNETTGEQQDAKVLEVHAPVSPAYFKINSGALNVTDNHPIYSVDGGWVAIAPEKALSEHKVEASALTIGATLQLVNGDTLIVESIEKVSGSVQTYNLSSIEDCHTFYADGILVHNKGAGSGGGNGGTGA